MTSAMVSALVIARRNGGALTFDRGAWRARRARLDRPAVRRLLQAGLVEPVARDRAGLATRVELNLRGADVADAAIRMTGGVSHA